MTDKEIIKALGFCEQLDDECLCRICPYFDVDYCGKALVKDALDLINRQQELLEAAANGQETLQKALAEKDKELMGLNVNMELLRIFGNKKLSYKIATLTAEKDRLIETFGECQERAIKDFAKAVIDGIDEGYISHSSDIVDFTTDYLRGKGDTE